MKRSLAQLHGQTQLESFGYQQKFKATASQARTENYLWLQEYHRAIMEARQTTKKISKAKPLQQRQSLLTFTKHRILKLRWGIQPGEEPMEIKMSCSRIAKLVGRHQATVESFVRKYKTSKEIERKGRKSVPRFEPGSRKLTKS